MYAIFGPPISEHTAYCGPFFMPSSDHFEESENNTRKKVLLYIETNSKDMFCDHYSTVSIYLIRNAFFGFFPCYCNQITPPCLTDHVRMSVSRFARDKKNAISIDYCPIRLIHNTNMKRFDSIFVKKINFLLF